MGRLAIIASMVVGLCLAASPTRAICVAHKKAWDYRLVVAPDAATCYPASRHAERHFEENMREFVEDAREVLDDPAHRRRWNPERRKAEFAAESRDVIVVGEILRVKARRKGTARRFRPIHRAERFGRQGTFHFPEVSSCSQVPREAEGVVATACCDTRPSRNFLCGSSPPPGFSRLVELVDRQPSNKRQQTGGEPPAG